MRKKSTVFKACLAQIICSSSKKKKTEDDTGLATVLFKEVKIEATEDDARHLLVPVGILKTLQLLKVFDGA